MLSPCSVNDGAGGFFDHKRYKIYNKNDFKYRNILTDKVHCDTMTLYKSTHMRWFLMKKKLLSAVAAATVLLGTVSGSYAVQESGAAALSPRASIDIVDGQIKGVHQMQDVAFVKAQFDGDVNVVSKKGDVLKDEDKIPSECVVKSGDDVLGTIVIPGDANMDAKINLSDVSRMLQHIAKWSVDVSEGSADVDKNGKVNLADASRMLQYIAKWNVDISDKAPVITVFEDGVTGYKLLANDSATDAKIAEGIKALTGNDIEIVKEVADGDKFITVGKNLWEKYDFIDGDAARAVEDTRAYIDTYGGNIYLTAATDAGITGCINYITNQAFTPELDMYITKGVVGELGDLETLVRPIFTSIEIKGLKKTHRLLHVTDSHLTTVYDDEETPERRANVMSRLNDWMMHQYRKPSYLYFNEYFNYAADISAEGIMLTGDITDSPSKSNRDILESAIDNSTVPAYYMYGNHDWSWNTNEATGDVYHSETFRHAYRSGFTAAVDKFDEDWSDYYSVIDKGEYMIVGIDNAWTGFPNFRPAYNGIKAAFDTAKDEGKPIILMLHVPIHDDGMHEAIPHITGNGYCVTEQSGNKMIYDMIVAEDSPVAAIIAGHVHANYESMIGNIPQIVTAPALEGYCRVIDLVPAE